jgi:branched-chain amino acid transport system ATP-binding protein
VSPLPPLLLALDRVSGGYGAARVLFGLSLGVAAGEVVVLLGRNGAGKSTTLKAVIGLLPSLEGSIRLEGRELAGLPPHRIARLGVGYVPEERRVFPELTVDENLEVGRQPPRPGVPAWTPEALFRLFPNLAAMRDRPGRSMSGGEQQMLTIARTLMGNPRLLLLDEPSEGLAPIVVNQVAASVRALKAAGVAVLLSEQNARFAAAVADRAYVLERGEVRFAGPMAVLAQDAELRRAHLGV